VSTPPATPHTLPRTAPLAADALSRRYPNGEGVGPVDAHFLPGVITTLVGPNGSGKSTLLRALAGVLEPDAGRVLLHGQPLHRTPTGRRARSLAYVPQRASLAFAFTVREYIAFGSHQGTAAAAYAIERMDLATLARRPMPSLSVGQQQRAAVARALAQLGGGDLAGKVLLADEPASALDTHHARELLGVLRSLADRGAAVVVACHDLPWAGAIADRVLALTTAGKAAMLPADALADPQRMASVFGCPFRRYEAEDGGPAVALPAGRLA